MNTKRAARSAAHGLDLESVNAELVQFVASDGDMKVQTVPCMHAADQSQTLVSTTYVVVCSVAVYRCLLSSMVYFCVPSHLCFCTIACLAAVVRKPSCRFSMMGLTILLCSQQWQIAAAIVNRSQQTVCTKSDCCRNCNCNKQILYDLFADNTQYLQCSTLPTAVCMQGCCLVPEAHLSHMLAAHRYGRFKDTSSVFICFEGDNSFFSIADGELESVGSVCRGSAL